MKIYIVLQDDRHTDTEATPFLDLDEAMEYARNKAKSDARNPEDVVEMDTPDPDGWLLTIRYSYEGDYIWITEHELTIS